MCFLGFATCLYVGAAMPLWVDAYCKANTTTGCYTPRLPPEQAGDAPVKNIFVFLALVTFVEVAAAVRYKVPLDPLNYARRCGTLAAYGGFLCLAAAYQAVLRLDDPDRSSSDLLDYAARMRGTGIVALKIGISTALAAALLSSARSMLRSRSLGNGERAREEEQQ